MGIHKVKALELMINERVALRQLMLQSRTAAVIANGYTQAATIANQAFQDYMFQLLASRGLDPNKWGFDMGLTEFQEIKEPPKPQPVPQAPGLQPVPALATEPAPQPAPEAQASKTEEEKKDGTTLDKVL